MVNEQQQQQSKEERSSYELIEVEDVVPKGANSLFLCVARTLIYLAYKNPPLVDVLNRRFGITADLLMSDIGLQYHIRTKLCQYFLKNGVYFDESEAVFKLKYSSFNGNVYDFLIQVYQLSINNYGANQLFNKHAIFALSRLLGMNIYCKKLNGQWRLAEHNDGNVASDATSKYLSSFTIYLRELQYTNQIGKNYRVLLPKKLWLSNRADNINISLRYTQFSDPNDFNLYQDQHFMIDSKKFIRFIVPANRELTSASQRAFCVLLHKINVAQITNRSIDEIKKTQLMSAFVGGDVAATIGRVFKHFENNQSIKNLEQFYCFLDTFVEKQGFFTRSKVDDIYLLLTKDARSNDLSAATFY